MVTLSEILSPQCVFLDVPGTSKKKVLQNISQILGECSANFSANDVFDHLIARERLGSTGFGNGVAIPHCRLAHCEKMTGAFFKLENPVDFDSIDKKPVDLIFVLLVPEKQTTLHLEVLSKIAEKFSENDFLESLRDDVTSDFLFQEITG